MIKAVFTLLLFCCARAAFAGDGIATGQADADFVNAANANQGDIASFLALPCVTDTGKGFVTGLQSATAAAVKSAQAEYHDYMMFVTKPMEGNGKCDGGFQGVETEAHNRQQRSIEAANRIQRIADDYNAATQANLFGPVIIYSNVAGEGCENSASDGYDALESGAHKMANQFAALRKSMLFEADQFGIYEARNRDLRIRCGEHPDTTEGPIRSAAGIGGVERLPASVGNNQNGASSITGIEQDEAKAAKGEVTP